MIPEHLTVCDANGTGTRNWFVASCLCSSPSTNSPTCVFFPHKTAAQRERRQSADVMAIITLKHRQWGSLLQSCQSLALTLVLHHAWLCGFAGWMLPKIPLLSLNPESNRELVSLRSDEEAIGQTEGTLVTKFDCCGKKKKTQSLGILRKESSLKLK